MKRIFKKSKEALIKGISKTKSKLKLEKKSKPAKALAKDPRKDTFSFQETAIANTKFFHGIGKYKILSYTAGGLLRGLQATPLKGDSERSERQRDEVPMDKKIPSKKVIPSVSEEFSCSAPLEVRTKGAAVTSGNLLLTGFARPMPQELPSSYDLDRIVLQVRDPYWLHAYWELRAVTIDGLKARLGDEFYRAGKVLRVYDVTNIIFNGSNANRFFDIVINDFANSWYINTAGPGRCWCVDLGLILADGSFITIIRSNVVQTPLDGPSWVTDEEWMIPDDMFARLYGMGFGLGKSSPVGGAWQERIKQELFSSGVSSSPVKKEIKGRSFWLKVDCELIVYGATEPDAKVTVQGAPIKLRQDGTFTLRYYLPDGKQVIPVKATSADKLEERIITPTVIRETK